MLLILAGITINALTGSDSAPAKANEAEQKNDIGSAKDQISLTATNAKLAAYDTAYVGNGVSSSEASNSVGRAVIKAVAEQIQANNQVGKATIAITGYGALDNINNDAMIEITTRDFITEGTITYQDGILTWGEIEENVPGIRITGVPTSIDKGSYVDLSIKRRDVTGDVTWTSGTTSVATIDPNTGRVNGIKAGSSIITASVTENGTTYTAECTIRVAASKDDTINSQIGTVIAYPKATATTSGYSADYNKTWKIFYANSEEMFIIPSSIVPASAVGFDSEGIPISNEAEANGSKSVANSSYGYKYNKLWLTKCYQINATGVVASQVKLNQNKHKATAYLCNPSNWDSFVAKTTGSNTTNLIARSYAVGGPTYELFIDAWNFAKNQNKSKGVGKVRLYFIFDRYIRIRCKWCF